MDNFYSFSLPPGETHVPCDDISERTLVLPMCVCILPFIVYGSNINHDSTSAQRNMPPTSCPPRDPIGVAVRREVRVHFAVVLDAKLSTVEGWLASLANMTAMVNNKMVFDEVST